MSLCKTTKIDITTSRYYISLDINLIGVCVTGAVAGACTRLVIGHNDVMATSNRVQCYRRLTDWLYTTTRDRATHVTVILSD